MACGRPRGLARASWSASMRWTSENVGDKWTSEQRVLLPFWHWTDENDLFEDLEHVDDLVDVSGKDEYANESDSGYHSDSLHGS
ncbi:hypothetical protein PG993_015146 [Apiospora rasikravindrae]|uniref:Uncharacterized protein n=1 Tax=Apiospora rasikravindrae TaxID=990691 RepID=A0ABR1RQ45_9PEZI